MAIVNEITGYYGFTLDGTEGSSSVNKNGQVDRCMVAIVYPQYKNDVTVTISKGSDDWGIKMGDDSIIPINNPKILFTNQDNCIVQFDMSTLYPSNSPCVLVSRSDTAKITITEQSSSSGEFEVNSVSGHFAFTVNTFGSDANEDGEVNKLIATIPFRYSISAVKVTISNGTNDWGARMGDGTIIPIRNPEILRTNSENVVVKFDMDRYYPANSPCILVYMSKSATITVVETDDDNEFHPVTNIIDVPTAMISGGSIDLNCAKVLPWNASKQQIDWAIVSGPATISNRHFMTANDQGTIKLRATVENGLTGADDVNDYVKTFTISVTKNTIIVNANPPSDMMCYVGMISDSISVVAKSVSDEIKYQWYRCTSRTYTSPVKLEGFTQSKMAIPTTLTKGEYFYYCELTSPGATTVKSTCCRVYVDHYLTAIKITPRTNTIPFSGSRDLDITWTPSAADKPKVTWVSSDSYLVNVDTEGIIRANLLPGKVTITAETIDKRLKDTLELTVDTYTPVSNIALNISSIDTDTNYTLSATVTPSNASYREVTWSVISTGGTGASITNGVLRAVTPGTAIIRATIEKGTSFNQSYSKEFVITVSQKFISVTNIILDTLPSTIYSDTVFKLSGSVVPSNASNNHVVFSVKDAGGTGASITDNTISFKSSGTVKILGKVINGVSTSSDYSKEFSLIVVTKNTAIPVTSAEINPLIFDPNTSGNSITLSIKAYPDNATSKSEYTIEMISYTPDTLGISFNTTTKVLSIDESTLIPETNTSVTFKIIIRNGISNGNDFITNSYMTIITPEPTEKFVSVEDIDLNVMTPARALYPILLNKRTITPPDSTEKSSKYAAKRKLDDGGAYADVFKMSDDYKNTYQDIINTFMFFDWENSVNMYLIGNGPGSIILEASIIDGIGSNDRNNTYRKDFTKSFDITFLDPFIKVQNISGIYNEVPVGETIAIYGETETRNGIDVDNVSWDNEKSTYDTIVFRMGSTYIDQTTYPNTSGATMTIDGEITSIKTTSVGNFSIQSFVEDGIRESLNWYGTSYPGVPYTQIHTIKVLNQSEFYKNSTATTTDPFIEITLNDGKIIKGYTFADLSYLCNNGPANSRIKVNNESFLKSDVISMKFLKLLNTSTNKQLKIKSLRNFGMNFTKLTTLSGDIPMVQTSDCMRNFLRGCTSFNQPISIHAGTTGTRAFMNFLRDAIKFNSKIELPSSLTTTVYIYNEEGLPDEEDVSFNDILHGFLRGCTSFNQPISIPDNTHGYSCLEAFLYGCTLFNQPLEIPTEVYGGRCLYNFLAECKSFNQNITLPKDVGVEGREIDRILFNCESMCADVTIPSATGENVNKPDMYTFSVMNGDCPAINNGIMMRGLGADALKAKMPSRMIVPYRWMNVNIRD